MEKAQPLGVERSNLQSNEYLQVKQAHEKWTKTRCA